MQVRRGFAVVALSVALVAAACTSDDGAGEGPSVDDGKAELEAHGGTGQIWLQTEPNVELQLTDASGEVVPLQWVDEQGEVTEEESLPTDDQGALVMRYVEPGEGYVVRRADDAAVQSNEVTVTSKDEHPDQSFYDEQTLEEGFGYLTTRDGTKLSINVTLPGPVEDGPYPTVVEYSGYDPSNPEPSLVTISKLTASQQGFATVGVNVRGSGCSGGSMQLWEDSQAVDGYDVIETVAAQPWVKDHTVGMVGISYPATAMLYTAATQPPSLSAIAPVAAYDDGFRALLWPGGIQNKGFAREWVEGRYTDSDPDNVEWVKERIAEGDETCKENMELRGQNLDLAALIDVMPYFPEVNDLGNSFAPYTFVDDIEVPTFLVASWQDEQVGGHAPTMVPNFENVPELYVTLMNGYHADGLANPAVLQRWLEFLQLYVAKEVPETAPLEGFSHIISGEVTKNKEAADALPFPPEHFEGMSYDEALEEFEAQDRVRVLFESGAGEGVEPGMPIAGFEEGFDAYPLDDVEPTTWYLGPDGTLTEDEPTEPDGAEGTVDAYTSDPKARPEVNLVEGEDPWAQLPKYDWQQVADDTSLSYATAPLDEDTVMLGTGSADLWVRSDSEDTDIQVTLTEIRPDGQEMYVQSGWVRGSKRKLDEERSTELQPLLTMAEDDIEPMPEGEFVPIRVEIYPFAHAFREGSRIRVTITAPGGDRPVWSFVNLDGTQENEVAHSEGMPSALVLPVVPGIDAPTPLPPCPSLRGQPCRPYEDAQG